VSGREDNLEVLTEHITELAGKQQASAGRIIAARNAVFGVTGRMWLSHGVVCAATNMAVAEAETTRAAAIAKRYKMSIDLRDRLNWAVVNYENADWRAGDDIGACGL
jgi:ESX secretion-associated protein EspC/F